MTVKPGFMATKMTEGMPLNPKLTATPKQAAASIYKAYKAKRNVAYVLPIWWAIMLIIKIFLNLYLKTETLKMSF